jgi:hypothetical protein
MTTIFERVTTALTPLNVPFALDPYLGTLPDIYLTYLLVDDGAEQHADDDETARRYIVQVSVRSMTGLAALPDVDGAMKAAGFQKRNGRQLPKDPDTGHYGLAKDYVYLETVP